MKIKFLSNFVILSIAIFIVAYSANNILSTQTSTTKTTAPVSSSAAKALELAHEAFQYANEIRAQNNKAPLTWDQDVADQANIHSKVMGDTIPKHQGDTKLSHDGFQDRFNNIYSKHSSLSAMGENVAETSEQPDVAKFVTDKWMGHPPHRDNLLDTQNYGFTKTGIGFYLADDNHWYATAIYAKF